VRRIGRENLRKRLAPLEGAPGRTSYVDGAVRIETETEQLVVRPPFGLRHAGEYERVHVEPLLAELAEDHVVAALLVRRGGYAIGVLDGGTLAASKVGSRFVKGRHRKGGSSSNRFRRRREEQTHALVEEAARVAVAVLQPWRERIEFVALGGDRALAETTAAAHDELAWLRERTLERFFAVPDPRLRVLETLPYELYSAELDG
jgi:peptide subunit release factor 1 (eRF1)